MWVMFSPEYLEYTLMGLILIPGIIYATIVSIKVNTTFSKYEKVVSSKNITGAECVRRILESQGIIGVTIQKSEDSELVDNFNPQTNIITLSSKVFPNTSL